MGIAESLFGTDGRILRERDFQALLLANLLGPLGTGVLSPILNSLIDPFGTSTADVGLLISFFTAPAIVMIPVAGLLADRVGRKPILLAGLVLLGAAGTAIAFTTDFRVALGLRLLQGAAFGGITPIIITSLGDIYEGSEEATAQGIRFTGSGLSSAAFPLLSGVLVVAAWQYPFFLYAASFPVAVVVYLWFEEPTDGDRERTSSLGTRLRALGELVTRRRVFAMVVARGLPMFVWIGFTTYNSIVVVELLSGSPTAAGAMFAIGSVLYAASASQAGRLTDRFGSRFYPLVGANLCLGAGFGLFVFAPTLAVAALGVTVLGIGFGVCMSLYRSIITGFATESLRGSFVSLAEAFGRVTSTATPVLMGAVIAATEPSMGIAGAVRTAGVGAALLSGGGVLVLVVAVTAPAVKMGVETVSE